MVLAAGRGERMRPLTDHLPKPLLLVHGKPLMQWPLEALARDGIDAVVVNTAWLGEQIEAAFGATCPGGQAREVPITYSHEGRDFGAALETAGGICRALPLLGDPFWVLAGDIHAPGWHFSAASEQRLLDSTLLAHLWLVPNPTHNTKGDFGIDATGLALNSAATMYTFSTLGLYRRALFEPPMCDIPNGNPAGVRAALAPLLRLAIAAGRVSAELCTGPWTDVGTPERLAQLNAASAATMVSD